MTLEEYYSKHKEEHRLLTRHGQVEFNTSLHYIKKYLPQNKENFKILDLGAGTGRYSVFLAQEGWDVTAVELTKHNVEVMRSKHSPVKIWQGDARNIKFLQDDSFDLTIFFGPLYHLHGDEEKLKAFEEAKRVTKKNGIILAAYVMNDYSILTYCFDQDRISNLLKDGKIDSAFHTSSDSDELYDYVRLEDIDRLNQKSGLKRLCIFSPDGASDYMRSELNKMSEESFELFKKYQLCIAERADMLGAGSHLVDVLENIK